jgi:hypothetical protein
MLVLEGIDHRLEQIERRLDEADRRELEDEARRNTEFLVRNRVEREAFIERVERFGTRTSAGRD